MANIIVLGIIAIAVGLAIRSMVRQRKAGKTSCGCDCGGCAMRDTCHSEDKHE